MQFPGLGIRQTNEIHAQIAGVVAFAISSTNAYLWNKYWVFSKSNAQKSLLKFYSTYITTFIMQQLAIHLLVHNGVSPYIAPIPAITVFFMINFLLSKFWTFRNNSQASKI